MFISDDSRRRIESRHAETGRQHGVLARLCLGDGAAARKAGAHVTLQRATQLTRQASHSCGSPFDSWKPWWNATSMTPRSFGWVRYMIQNALHVGQDYVLWPQRSIQLYSLFSFVRGTLRMAGPTAGTTPGTPAIRGHQFANAAGAWCATAVPAGATAVAAD